MPATFKDAAEAMLTRAGVRLTRARIEVLAVLLGAERALTHHEVESRIGRAPAIDRVTVYRVLDWLSREGYAHKIAGDDRVWRYNAAEDPHEQAHAHFQCARCGTVICLEDVDEPARVRVPKGFVLHQVELTAKGYCATCAHADAAARRRPSRAAAR
jgi:Fur family ferric uptake transcriptional regulator